MHWTVADYYYLQRVRAKARPSKFFVARALCTENMTGRGGGGGE